MTSLVAPPASSRDGGSALQAIWNASEADERQQAASLESEVAASLEQLESQLDASDVHFQQAVEACRRLSTQRFELAAAAHAELQSSTEDWKKDCDDAITQLNQDRAHVAEKVQQAAAALATRRERFSELQESKCQQLLANCVRILAECRTKIEAAQF